MLGIILVAAIIVQQPQSTVQRAVQAMGGESALRSLRSVTADYYATTFGLGQSETAESPPRAGLATGRVTTDWQGWRRVRTQEARAVTGQVARLRRVTAGGIGFAETGAQATPNPDNPAVVVNVERQMRREPERLLLAALDNPGALSALPARTFRNEQHDGVRFALGPDSLNLYFDRRNGLLTVVEAVTDDAVLGDRRTELMYTRWQPAGDVRLPRQVDAIVNGQQAEHLIYTAVTTNGALDAAVFVIPDSIAARARSLPQVPPALTVNLVELAPGVWRAEGAQHHTLVVEQGNELLLIESPQSAARMAAVFDTLRSRFAGRRISAVINTHHHWDHAGGVRAALAAGLPIVTHARNAAFIRRVASAPKTVAPDELSRRRRDPSLRLVSDSMVVGSGDSRVVVYPIATIHAEDVLAVWVPSARIVFTSDVLNPPAMMPGSRELVAFARARGLSPERYAGGHGVMVNWVDIERAAN